VRFKWIAAVVVAAGVVLVAWISVRREEAALWMLDRGTRPIEPRLSSAPAMQYRPLEIARGGVGTEAPPLEALARLQQRGDVVGVAEAYLLRGQAEAARPFVEGAPPTADALSTRAALELMVGRPEEALRHASAALHLMPAHRPARWNRALALRGLGLPFSAALELGVVAEAGEPGWAEEARASASALQGEAERRQAAYRAAFGRCRASMARGDPFPVDVVEVSARLARLCFYDTVRGAGTAERLAALEAPARALDARWDGAAVGPLDAARATRAGSSSLGAMVGAVAAARAALSPARAALSRRYAEAVERGAGTDAWLALADDAARAKQPDIELGALYWVPTAHLDVARYQRLALSTSDSWFAALADEKAAAAERQRGEPTQSLERLAPVEARCGAAPRVEDRCANAHRAVAYAYALQHQLLRAREADLKALELARRDGDQETELGLLEELGQVARMRGDLPLTHAYLEEALARAPHSCAVQDYVRSNLALAHQRALEAAEARRQVDLVTGCQPPSFSRMFAIADLQRSAPAPDDLASLERGAAALRAPGTQSPGDQALVTHLLGRAWLERDRPRGLALLRQSIAEAERAATSGETDRGADKARLYGYTSLLLDAGRRGDLRGALALFAEERRWAAPPACSLWLASDDERLLVLAADRAGAVSGHFDGARKKPITPEESLVPDDLLAILRACPAVQVIARPPLEGRPNLLPPEIAWSEVVRRGAAPDSSSGSRVVIAGALPPASLRLPQLRSAPPASTGAIRLEGAAATPSRVLEALRGAALVEIHAHGVVDAEVADASYLALSPEPSGKFAFTASDLKGAALTRHPLVLLAACHAAETTPFLEEGYGLPESFVAAGARAVLAATAPLPDAQSEPFFRPLLDHIQSGMPPAEALRDARVAWRAAHCPSWADSVLLFE